MAGRSPEHATHIPHTPLPDIRGGLRWITSHWAPVGLTAATLLGGAYLWITHDRGPQNPPTEPTKASDSFKPAEEMPAVVDLPAQPAEAAPAAPATTADQSKPSSETRVEAVPCAIFQPEVCTTARRIETTTVRGEPIILIGLNVPPGEEIRSPRSGQATRVEIKQQPPGLLKGFQTTISDPNSESSGSVFITGDLEFDKQSTMNVQEGTVIGRVGNRGIENFGFNVVARHAVYDPTLGKAVSDIAALERQFPTAFKNPPLKREYPGSVNPGQYFGGNIYRDNKP